MNQERLKELAGIPLTESVYIGDREAARELIEAIRVLVNIMDKYDLDPDDIATLTERGLYNPRSGWERTI